MLIYHCSEEPRNHALNQVCQVGDLKRLEKMPYMATLDSNFLIGPNHSVCKMLKRRDLQCPRSYWVQARYVLISTPDSMLLNLIPFGTMSCNSSFVKTGFLIMSM